MWELWAGETGSRLAHITTKPEEEAWDAFFQHVRRTLDDDRGVFLELRRTDGSIAARCTIHLGAPPS